MDIVRLIIFILSLFIITCLITCVYSRHIDDRVFVRASDGRTYLVRNTSKRTETAESLAKLNIMTLQLISAMERDDDPDRRVMIARLRARFDPSHVTEGDIDPQYTSYTINKGEEVVMCLRTRDGQDKLYDMDKLFYVFMHELAHIASITRDHNAEFKDNFAYLLREAERHGLYHPIGAMFDYCGLNLHETRTKQKKV